MMGAAWGETGVTFEGGLLMNYMSLTDIDSSTEEEEEERKASQEDILADDREEDTAR